MEEREAGVKKEKQELIEEVGKPKQKNERHRVRKGSKEKNPNLHGDGETVNDLPPNKEVRERRISKRESKDPEQQREEERRAQKDMTERSAVCEERSFRKQAKEMRKREDLRKEMELKVPKPPQRQSPTKPAALIVEGSPEEPPTPVSPGFPLSPESPLFPESHRPSELRLVLLGESWAFNSSAGNSILDKKEAVTEEGAGRSGTSGGGAADGALRGAALCSPGPHAFLLVIPAYLSFTASYGRAVNLRMDTLGKRVWKHTVVLFTWAEALGESIDQHILRSEGLSRLVQRCGNRYLTLHSWRNTTQVSQLLEKVEKMVVANGGGFYSWAASEEEEEAELEEEEEEEGAGGRTEADRTAGERMEWSERKWAEKKTKDDEETRETDEDGRIVESLSGFSASSFEGLQEKDKEEDEALLFNPPTEPQTPMWSQTPHCSLL
ncbi:hypothetical protein SKAU_G00428530 [Synaphobranchus kaupii]|uniref:AIG1-type G domain-containing protein n=1 Tax=Synaphobranchus kaupii TaxID=118154 RepID=A0A9Q1I8A6_SYNKA|nr:hypothetical protein SKAU_G00428530 [Synaphobranchus kaupii]